MAGIGFELRKLTRRDDLLGVLQGTAHSALASTGPWLFTIVLLGGVVLLGSRGLSRIEAYTFQLIVIYNFAFSLVMSAPVVMLATRLLADAIFEKQVERAPTFLMLSLGSLFAGLTLVAAPFYLFYVHLSPAERFAALANFFLITGIWAVSIFLTALKNYRAVTSAFLAGVVAGFAGCVLMAPRFGVAGMLAGFDAGLALIFFTLTARVYAEYPYAMTGRLSLPRNIRRYWEIGLGGLIYSLAIWVDKWIMWGSPQRRMLPSGMVSYPDYDSGMFLAYLSIVPAMAIFVFSIETDFYEKYRRFYSEIQRHASFGEMEEYHRDIQRSLLHSFRNLVVFQGSISLITILLAPGLFGFLGIGFTQIGIFRFGVLGALFHSLYLFMSIVLSYFDLRHVVLTLHTLFLVSNTVFTLWSLFLGFPWYGYGYFLSSLVSFVAALLVAVNVVGRLPYQAFVRTNLSIR
jgi:uncharacterized membrane protein